MALPALPFGRRLDADVVRLEGRVSESSPLSRRGRGHYMRPTVQSVIGSRDRRGREEEEEEDARILFSSASCLVCPLLFFFFYFRGLRGRGLRGGNPT